MLISSLKEGLYYPEKDKSEWWTIAYLFLFLIDPFLILFINGINSFAFREVLLPTGPAPPPQKTMSWPNWVSWKAAATTHTLGPRTASRVIHQPCSRQSKRTTHDPSAAHQSNWYELHYDRPVLSYPQVWVLGSGERHQQTLWALLLLLLLLLLQLPSTGRSDQRVSITVVCWQWWVFAWYHQRTRCKWIHSVDSPRSLDMRVELFVQEVVLMEDWWLWPLTDLNGGVWKRWMIVHLWIRCLPVVICTGA